MKKIFTFLILALMVSVAFAQRPSGTIMQATSSIEIDGVIDALWDDATKFDIDKPFTGESPTVGMPGETYWKALWSTQGIYVLVVVNDDNWYPSYLSGTEGWASDKIEVYFDVNYSLADGLGVAAPGGPGSGHYQIAPDPNQERIDGTPTTWDEGTIWAYKVADPSYVFEVFVPWSHLKDKDGIMFDKMGTLGFDVTVADNDATNELGRQRMVWANIGAISESWNNLDDVGYLTLDGAEPGIYIDKITLVGGEIKADNGQLKIEAIIEPEDATNKDLRWTVEPGTGRARINNQGVLTAITDGTVTVIADAADGSYEQAMIEVTISNQVVTKDEINIIRNGNFEDGLANWGSWISPDDGGYGQAPVVIDNVANLVVTQASADQWRYQFNQQNLTALPDVPYVLSYKAWSTKDRIITVDFEDTEANNYTRYGTSPDENAVNGESEWPHPVTTEPQWFNWNVTFDRMVPTTIQKVQFMISQDDGTVFIDSVMLLNTADLDLITEGDILILSVKMGYWADLGKFDPAEDFVDVAGTFNEWSGGENYRLQPVNDADMTYRLAIYNLVPEAEHKFKFRINGSWDDNTGEFPSGGPDRVHVMNVGVNNYSAWYNDELRGTNVDEIAAPTATLSVYPNPARETLNIVSEELIKEVRLINALGQVVYSQSIDFDRAQIQVGGFDRGLYLIQVLTTKGVAVERVLINR